MDLPHTPNTGTGNPGYHVPLEDAIIPTADRIFFDLVNARDARSATTAEESISQENTQGSSTQTPDDSVRFLEQSPVTPETPEESRKRKIPNVPEVAHSKNDGKLPRSETCGMGNEFVSISCETSWVNPDFMNLISTPSHKEFESSCYTSINPEDQNIEKWNFQNQKLYLPVFSGNSENINIQQNIELNKNILQKDKTPLCLGNEFVSSLCVTSCVNPDFKNLISTPSHTEFEISPFTSINPEDQKIEKWHFQNQKLYLPVQNGSPLKQQPPVETEQKQPKCLACQQTIPEHGNVHDGNYSYKCCRCNLRLVNFNYLQIHVYNEHTKDQHCNVCQMNYSENGSHARGGMCDVCYQNFECKFQLEEHYILVHKAFLEANCTICKRKLDEHLTVCEGFKYQCCIKECKFKPTCKSKLKKHLGGHTLLKLSKCEVCGDHFKGLQNHIRRAHPLCKSCDKRFLNIFFLNDHHCEKQREV